MLRQPVSGKAVGHGHRFGLEWLHRGFTGAQRRHVRRREIDETDKEFEKKRRMSWAARIKSVYEVDPLQCPNCGGRMKIISYIEKCQPTVIKKILKHCGMWKETVQRPPPQKEPTVIKEPSLDYEFLIASVFKNFQLIYRLVYSLRYVL